MKDFIEYKKEQDNLVQTSENVLPDFSDFHTTAPTVIEYLTEEENMEVEKWLDIFEKEHNGVLDEGFLSKLLGGTAGFIVGPSVGKIIANALGVKGGILHDMLTSRVVSAALGVALAKHFGGEYKDQ